MKLYKNLSVGVMFHTDRRKNTWMGSHYEASIHCALQTQLKIIFLLQFEFCYGRRKILAFCRER